MRIERMFSTFLAILAGLALAGEAAAQETPLRLYSVDPPQGRPGQEMELILRGEGFQRVEIVRVEIEGVEIRDYWVDSNESIRVMAYVPESAPPGARGVIVVGSMGQNEPVAASLADGFFVQERPGEPPPTEEPQVEIPPDGPPIEAPNGPEDAGLPTWILVLLLGSLGLGGIGGGALLVSLRNAGLRRAWEREAQSGELPEKCQPSTHITRREKVDIKPGRWKVTGIKVTLYDSKSDRGGKVHSVPADSISTVDQAIRRRSMHGEDDRLSDMITRTAREMAALITAWQSVSESGADAYLEATMEGGSAEAKFARYRCVGQPGGWQRELEWTAKLKAVDHLPAAFRGPVDGEPKPGYRAFLEGKLQEYLALLVREAARLL